MKILWIAAADSLAHNKCWVKAPITVCQFVVCPLLAIHPIWIKEGEEKGRGWGFAYGQIVPDTFFLTHFHHCSWNSTCAFTLMEPQAPSHQSPFLLPLLPLWCTVLQGKLPKYMPSAWTTLSCSGCYWPFSRCWQLIVSTSNLNDSHLHIWIP